MKITILFALLMIFFSCKKKLTFDKANNTDSIISINQITSDYDSLINKVKYRGSIEAYDELFYSFMDANESERTDTLMIYSKIMAEKYNHEKAYLDFFKALCEKYDIRVDYPHYDRIDLSKIPTKPRNEAKDWLKKMLEKNIITKKQYDSIKK